MSTVTADVKDFEYTEADAERLASPPQLRDGMFELAVVDTDTRDNDKTHDMQIALEGAPVDANGVAHEGPTIRYYLGIPLLSKFPGHKLTRETEDKYCKRAEKFIRAVDPKYLPRFFTKNEAGVYVNEDGAPLTARERKSRNVAIKSKVLAKLREWYQSPQKLVGARFYAMITTNPESDYSNIFWVSAEPGQYDVIRSDFAK